MLHHAIQKQFTIFRCKAIMKPCAGPGKVVTVSVSLSPAKLPELAELFPLDCRSCDTGESSSTTPILAPGVGGMGVGLDEDDYNRSNPTQCIPTSNNRLRNNLKLYLMHEMQYQINCSSYQLLSVYDRSTASSDMKRVSTTQHNTTQHEKE
jgi:hypothetical protein